MNALQAMSRQFIRDEAGVTAIEYGLIAAAIALAVATASGLVSDALTTVFGNVVTALNT